MSKRPRGRPPIEPGDASVNVHVRLPSKTYDDACDRARRERVTVPEVLRRALRRDELRHLK